MNLTSILYYLNFSWFIVYINSIEFNINRFKLIINRDNITYDNILSAIRCMIDGIINSNDRNKTTMLWEGVSPLDNHSKMQASPMNVHELAAVPGSSPALIIGSPDIKPNGKYDTPPMVYIPGGNNQPMVDCYQKLFKIMLWECIIQIVRVMQLLYNDRLTSSMRMLTNSLKIFLDINILIEREIND